MANAKVVRILGNAHNLISTPLPRPAGVEVWCANDPRGYYRYLPRDVVEAGWTRWFNLHSRAHMDATYPRAVEYWKSQDGSRPFYTQKVQADFPGCVEFPRKKIQEYFATSKGPIRYFASSVNWLVPFAYLEGFRHIEFWGFALSDRKPNKRWVNERKCFFYWLKRLGDMGMTFFYQPEIHRLQFEVGDPESYDGPLYGYSTKPEPGWDPVLEDFV